MGIGHSPQKTQPSSVQQSIMEFPVDSANLPKPNPLPENSSLTNQDPLQQILQQLTKLKKLDNIESMIKDSIKAQNERITNLESDNLQLNQKVRQIQRDYEMILKELREKNIIICGVEDSADENEDTLFNIINDLLPENPEDETPINIESFHRIGKYRATQNRPIRVKFSKISDRNLIYHSRGEVEPPIVIKEDLPFSTRRDYAALYRKKQELLDIGISSEINFKTRSIESEVGQIYNVYDGIIELQQKPSQGSSSNTTRFSTSSQQTGNRTINKRKRIKITKSASTQPTRFLGQRNEQNIAAMSNNKTINSSHPTTMDMEET
ncbi:unnamed protein product [Orchesella dallaii]|uniref:Uncharacterized protein n=1 Tax=Orchesella dallaii TaxID=48710 RepID=A0ABP1PJG1_9HEXA